MRLIDADALIAYCDKNWIPLNVDAVNAQPTIEPEKRTEKRTETHACDCISRVEPTQTQRRLNADSTQNCALDCIGRQAAIEHLKKRLYETEFNSTAEYPYYQEIADNRVDVWMNEVPAAQTDLSEYSDKLWKAAYERGRAEAQAERKTGRWVSVGCIVPDIANVPMIKCTVCGHLEPDVDAARTPYCSHCGADMRGGQDD